jgi:hypothetical protein
VKQNLSLPSFCARLSTIVEKKKVTHYEVKIFSFFNEFILTKKINSFNERQSHRIKDSFKKLMRLSDSEPS